MAELIKMDNEEFERMSHQELIELASRLNVVLHERLTLLQLQRSIRQTELK